MSTVGPTGKPFYSFSVWRFGKLTDVSIGVEGNSFLEASKEAKKYLRRGETLGEFNIYE